jgi:hypothetical protein
MARTSSKIAIIVAAVCFMLLVLLSQGQEEPETATACSKECGECGAACWKGCRRSMLGDDEADLQQVKTCTNGCVLDNSCFNL